MGSAVRELLAAVPELTRVRHEDVLTRVILALQGNESDGQTSSGGQVYPRADGKERFVDRCSFASEKINLDYAKTMVNSLITQLAEMNDGKRRCSVDDINGVNRDLTSWKDSLTQIKKQAFSWVCKHCAICQQKKVWPSDTIFQPEGSFNTGEFGTALFKADGTPNAYTLWVSDDIRDFFADNLAAACVCFGIPHSHIGRWKRRWIVHRSYNGCLGYEWHNIAVKWKQDKGMRV